MDEIEQAKYQGWCECLNSVRGSLKGYPNCGGDIEIMKEVERLREQISMTPKNIVDLMGMGLTLKVAKEGKEAECELPTLIGLHYLKHITPIILDRRVVDRLVTAIDYQHDPLFPVANKICLVEEGDTIVEGILRKKGWRSEGLEGEKYDYYRMVQ